MALAALLAGGVIAVFGLLLVVLGGRELWFAIRVYRGAPLSVAEAANNPGPVEVVGTAQPDEGTTVAPFSDFQCLICEWELQREETTGGTRGSRTHWKTLDQGLRGGPFRLEDETASCRVEPSGSNRHLRSESVTVRSGDEPPASIRRFADSYDGIDLDGPTLNLGFTELTLGDKYRFVERRLDAGEDCYVYGNAHYDTTAGSRAGEVNVRIDGRGIRRFVIADSRERGVVWEQAKIGMLPLALGLVLVAGGLFLVL